ncbi:TRAP transporter small permease [Wenxinia marina]|uniref:TRAP transporter small permease n=1 Tax=Wenxinia marina TaxID=390641 RepID=UPI001C3083A5|nr:TRAP transporter small permease [Wenxinia marina]
MPDPAGPAPGPFARAEAMLLSAMRWAIVAAMTGMILVVALQVASRFVVDRPFSWTEEVARFLFICLVFLGTAVLARREEHLTVTVLVDLLPPRLRHAAAAVAAALAFWCTTFLVRGGWATLLREWDQRTPALRLPMGVIFAIVLLSCALMLAWLALHAIRHARFALRRVPA